MNAQILIASGFGLLVSAFGASPATPAENGVNLALIATPSSSYVSGDTRDSALNDGSSPRSSRGDRRGAYGNWPRRGTQWVQYEWTQPISTGRIEVYWWDDRQGVRLPKASQLEHWDGKEFVPVNNARGLGIAGDQFNVTTFDEVTTSRLRLEMDGDGEFSTGILEWRVLDSGRSPDFPPRVVAGVDRVVILGGRTYLNGKVQSLKPGSVAGLVKWMMQATLEDWIPKILAAQEPDGYLQTAYTLADRSRWPERWGPRNRGDHEGYVAGYFLESAINHYTLTEGKDRRLYEAAKRLADCWVANLGPGRKKWYDGHQEMEQALVRFGRFVNDLEGDGRGDEYVKLAKFLLDCRQDGSEYDQSHVPVQQQYEAVGHAVRAVYNYSAMADVAAETGDLDYQSAVMSLWDNLVNRKYYVTGGVGSGETSEGFGPDYSLRHNAYCESCSSCGLIFFQYKLNLTMNSKEARNFSVHVRVPDRNTSALYTSTPVVRGLKAFSVNGQPTAPRIEKGYAVVTREWKAGDQIALELPMEVQRIQCDERVLANRGLTALRYGPLIYNVERADQPDLDGAISSQPLTTEWRGDLLQGVKVIQGSWTNGTPLVAIPHYARNNRLGQEAQGRGRIGESSSQVWIKLGTGPAGTVNE